VLLRRQMILVLSSLGLDEGVRPRIVQRAEWEGAARPAGAVVSTAGTWMEAKAVCSC